MSELINVADDVYAALTKIKKERKASYSEVIRWYISEKPEEKKYTFKDLIATAKEWEAKATGKKEKIDHDKIIYGVSREGN